MKDKIRIGCGAGFSGDRLEPAVVLAKEGQLDYLVLECLAERTIALAQKSKLQDPASGYDPMLERRIRSLLPVILDKRIRLITNMGAANPLAAADRIIQIARENDIRVKVAVITGDDVLDRIEPGLLALETGLPLIESGNLVSANAYLGTEGILEALQTDASIIITGRVADPSLFLAPMMHEFSWRADDFNLLGKGTIAGHLLECAGQLTGGYFADPVKKPVPGMANLGHPFADVYPNGKAVFGKVPGTGGVLNLQTVKEQLLYEVVNPYEYYTPDVIADFTTVRLKQTGPDQVEVTGGNGKSKPESFKVSVGYQAFYLGEGEITYAGENAVARARLAAAVVSERLSDLVPDIRVDYIGLSSVHRTSFMHSAEPYEIRLRIAGKASTPDVARRIGEEVEALYTNGPAGGGGVRKNINEVIGIVSVLMPRKQIVSRVDLKST